MEKEMESEIGTELARELEMEIAIERGRGRNRDRVGIVPQPSSPGGFPECTRKRRLEWCTSLPNQTWEMSFSVAATLELIRKRFVMDPAHMVRAEA